MVLSFLWVVTLTAPLIALMLSAGSAALPKPVSETGFVTTAPNATDAAVPPDVARQYWKRDRSREIKSNGYSREGFSCPLRNSVVDRRHKSA
jgi:hypothetical protein